MKQRHALAGMAVTVALAIAALLLIARNMGLFR
jgi:hypothetical protein